MKKICLFCGGDHKRRYPKLCKAKGEIIRSYAKAGVEMWKIMAGIASGLIKLEAEALELLHKRGQLR